MSRYTEKFHDFFRIFFATRDIFTDPMTQACHEKKIEKMADAAGDVPLFGGLDTQNTLLVLKEISETQYFQDQGLKKVPASYKVWTRMSDGQKAKVVTLFASLPESIRVVVQNRTKDMEDCVATTAQTTKNDKVRVLELRMHTGAMALWSKALGTLNRQELDAQRSHESDDRDIALQPWNTLASIFNNRFE